jgi:uncharacterized protein with HEPN domain
VRDPKERRRDILDAIANIERYAARGRQAFEKDELIQSWFVRHRQIIGEAAYACRARCEITSRIFHGQRLLVCGISLSTTTL